MFFGLNDVGFLAAVSAPAPALDPDAAAYIAAVEAADTQALEPAVRAAINDFVVGCKADGIWSAIKASCILAGARTLTGALVPLAGAAPTNFNFASGDYDRKTGLVGDGSTKYLNSNRNNNADPRESKHLSVYKTSNPVIDGGLIGSSPASSVASWILEGTIENYRVNTSSSVSVSPLYPDVGFVGVSRSSAAFSDRRYSGATYSDGSSASNPSSQSIEVFRAANNVILTPTDARLAFYSIGESLDLALLDARVTALINAFDAAI
jgi:hypothetical protein